MADPDPEISGGPGLKKYFFQSLGPQFGLKIRGGGGGAGPPGPSLGSTTEGMAQGGGNLNNNCPMLGLSPVKGLFQKNPRIYIPSL